MKKIFVLLLVLTMCVSLTACESPSEGNKNYESSANLIAVTGYKNLYYDNNTKIVYFIFNEYEGYQGYGYMSPYYSSNGLPYLYDENNHALIEINE